MTDLGNHDLDLPFEPNSPTPMNPAEPPLIAGGMVVMATIADVPGVGLKPGLVFKFCRPDGVFYQSIMYVTDDDQLAKLRPLINAAIAAARRGALTTNRDDLPPPFQSIEPCPECRQGKHQNCTDQVPYGTTDQSVECPCQSRGHAS